MLCLALTAGEYLTIGDNVVIQVGRVEGGRCQLVVHAPREIAILRGEVLEREGGQRPACIFRTRSDWKNAEQNNPVSPG